MSTLIVYATKHGCTEKCANMLAEKLNGKVDLYNVRGGASIELEPFEKVIIGGSIHMGKIQKEISSFCTKNLPILKDKKVGLFVCGMLWEQAETELNNAFPRELSNIAIAMEFFGGEFKLNIMNSLERLIVKKVSRIDKDTSSLSDAKINDFAEAMNS